MEEDMLKAIRYLVFLAGWLMLLLAIGFVLQLSIATRLWPWPDGRLSYLFVGSILAAASAAALWIGWSGELGALPAGAMTVFVTALGSSLYFLRLAFLEDRTDLIAYGIGALLMAGASGAAFLWSRRLPLGDARPTPRPVRISFWIFVAALLLAAGALLMRLQIFPWPLNPDSAVIFGLIFLGDAFYFLYGLLYPRWHNAKGQLLSFLAYDLVLIFPFLLLFGTVQPGHAPSLTAYVIVLLYSGTLAAYYLFINAATRDWP
jgi:hypothetical protein